MRGKNSFQEFRGHKKERVADGGEGDGKYTRTDQN